MSGNLSSIISDHFFHFLIEPSKFTKKSPQMVYRKRCYKHFDKFQFRADLIKVNWGSFCHDPDPNSAVEYFLKIVEKLLNKHAPYKITKHPKSQFQTKPWITAGLAYSIKIKNKLYKSFCKEKDPHKKENHERQFKTYHNLISTLFRKTKESYYKQYFCDNKKNLKLVWRTIKGIISIKSKSDESISSFLIDNLLITSAKKISNHFNNFFTSIAEKINRNIVEAKKIIFYILVLNLKTQSFFLQQYLRT